MTQRSETRLAILVARDDNGGRGIMFGNVAGMNAAGVNVMAIHARGVIAAMLGQSRAFALDFAPMRGARPRRGRPHFLASVEATACTETGISAHERALTLAALGNWASSPADFVSPGHIFPAVPADDPADWQLCDVAYHYCQGSEGALAIAWCDVLDARGDVASAEWCYHLADELGLEVLSRNEALSRIEAGRMGLAA